MGDDIRRLIPVEDIAAQREKGWVDFHPEDYCHRCGGPNIVWYTPSDVWNPVMRAAGPNEPEPFEGIVCPVCFVDLTDGADDVWALVSDTEVDRLRAELNAANATIAAVRELCDEFGARSIAAARRAESDEYLGAGRSYAKAADDLRAVLDAAPETGDPSGDS